MDELAVHSWPSALVLGFGSTALMLLAIVGFIRFMGWVDDRGTARTNRRNCLVCQRGDGVLLNDRSDLPVYSFAEGWCPEHRQRLERLRNLEHGLFGDPGPNQYRTPDGRSTDPGSELMRRLQQMPPKEPGAASLKDGGIR